MNKLLVHYYLFMKEENERKALVNSQLINNNQIKD